jgi:hypothetical protein
VHPVVAVDIDGTIADYHSHMLDFAQEYFGRWLPNDWDGSGNWEDYLGLPRQAYQEMKLAFRQGGQKRTMPIQPFVRDLWDSFLGVEDTGEGAEVWLTTTRPYNRHDSVDPDTREWLRRHNIEFDFLLYDDDKYGRLSQLVDPDRVLFVIDDLPEQFERATQLFGYDRAWLVKRQHNRAYAGQLPPTALAGSLLQVATAVADKMSEWYKEHRDGAVAG